MHLMEEIDANRDGSMQVSELAAYINTMAPATKKKRNRFVLAKMVASAKTRSLLQALLHLERFCATANAQSLWEKCVTLSALRNLRPSKCKSTRLTSKPR